LESIGHVLAPVIMPDGETARDLFGESAEAAAHAASLLPPAALAEARRRGDEARRIGAAVR
jgi:hypothetical protein